MTAIFSPAVRLRRQMMRANFGDIIEHCRTIVGWHPDDTADILIAVGGDKVRFSAAIDKWLRVDNRPGASAPNGAASLLKFITEGGL